MTVKWYGDDILKAIRDAVPDALFEAGEKFIEIAASRAPHDDNDLRNSGYVTSENKSTYKKKYIHRAEAIAPKGTVVAGFAAFYAHMVEFGTKPHKIGKPGQKLRMPDGKIVRGPLQHPGTPAKPFIRPTIDEAKAQLGDIVATGVKGQLEFKKPKRANKK